jgi:hypothetical protein
MNTQEIKHYISTLSLLDNLFYIDNNFFIVNLDWLTNRDYQNQGVNELLYVAGAHHDKVFIFLARDGVNCNLTGLSYVITQIVQNLDLSSERCFIYSYQNLTIPNTTYVEFDVIQMWCSMIFKEVKSLPISKNAAQKRFCALFGRHDLFRLKLTKHLYENHKEQSLLSYNSNIANWNYRFSADFFIEDQKWYQTHCPLLLDFEKPQGWVPFQESLTNIHKHYETYFLEIVSETDPHSNRFFTEKTLKNFYLGKPFILLAGPKSLEYLKLKGFRTFSPFIDESYDNISCPNKRLECILNEIDRIANLGQSQLNDIVLSLQDVFSHNRQNFLKFV